MATLVIWSAGHPSDEQTTYGLDVSTTGRASDKATALTAERLDICLQSDFASNPMTILTLDSRVRSTSLLQDFASSLGGITSGDSLRFRREFWEVPGPLPEWLGPSAALPR